MPMKLQYSCHSSYTTMGTTRVANNSISENCAACSGGLGVLALQDGRLAYQGGCYGDDPEPIAQRAVTLGTDWPSVPWLDQFPRIRPVTIRKRSVLLGPRERTRILERGIALFEKHGYKLSGVVASVQYDEQVWNSRSRNRISWKGSQLHLSVTASDPDNTIESSIQANGTTIENLRATQAWRTGLEVLMLQDRLPVRELAPGTYPAVLTASGLANVALFCSWYGLNGEMAETRRAFTSDEDVGRRIFSPQVTITDEPMHPKNPYWCPADGFGNRKERRKILVADGVLAERWYDFFSAKKNGALPTGHGSEMFWGPGNLCMRQGSGPTTVEGAVRALGNGLLIHDLHYNRLVSADDGSFTGMTRYGTFIVEDGEIVARTPNLRFVESVPHLLSDVVWLSRRRQLTQYPEMYGIRPTPFMILPAFAQFSRFNITGATPLDP